MGNDNFFLLTGPVIRPISGKQKEKICSYLRG